MAAAKKDVEYRVTKECYWSPPGEKTLHRTPTNRGRVTCPEFPKDETPSFLEKVESEEK